ncbi:short-chain dehydrogenase/reductase SDR [Spirochaeta thermophila DSM 6578]|uniref:Short-chain dehydrogenase/reductase SDR n=1 Tax=Winmispira thermophila (strain ATCC 700085 / DSM 6578 / Z-1203) TaxID=869211 RepID=G0GAI7_WINT7|nr:SDR family oxidoreductase [Spirochaeta thermophila]AEJ61806.1 short-chain dehydrogenase/reductase SDR [Spirochaeta thermophila DSM 6578]
MSEVRGAITLITGAASGFGKLLALRVAQEGGDLVLVDRDKEGLEATSEACGACGVKVWPYVVDISSREEIFRTAARIKDEAGPVDILVNNAGVVTGRSFREAPVEKIEATFAVNTLAHVWLVKAFLEEMIARNRGHIVTISSAAGIIGVRRLADYCASKFAVFGFTEALRMEFKKEGLRIKTTIVAPYYAKTGMFEGVRTRVPWVLPLLEPEYVVARIFKAIKKDRPLVVLPPVVRSVWFFRLLGVRVFDAVADVLGVHTSMDTFVGRRTS